MTNTIAPPPWPRETETEILKTLRPAPILIFAATAAFFAAFFLYPIGNTVGEAFVDADGNFTLGAIGHQRLSGRQIPFTPWRNDLNSRL